MTTADMVDNEIRAHIIATTRTWLGTPYHHQQSVRGIGTDCLGLVRGIWREVLGREPELPPPYAPDWADATGDETLLAAARRHLVEVSVRDARAADVLVFRYRAAFPAKHVGILVAPDRFVHAQEGLAVSEVALTPWWMRRIAAAFAFPGISS